MEKKILIMDDECDIRELLSDMLTLIGYKVASSSEGKETIKLYKSSIEQGEPYDAVILDLTIPNGMGGEETAAHLRLLDPTVCTIYSSGFSENAPFGKKNGTELPLILSKPYTIEDLDNVVAKAMRISRCRRNEK